MNHGIFLFPSNLLFVLPGSYGGSVIVSLCVCVLKGERERVKVKKGIESLKDLPLINVKDFYIFLLMEKCQ